MSRIDDALRQLEREPGEDSIGYITPADIAAAFHDLWTGVEEMSLVKQDVLPSGANGDILMWENATWIPKPLPQSGGLAGTLSGAGAPLPSQPIAGALYLIGADVPTAVTAVLPSAVPGDIVTWDGTTWLETNAAGGGGTAMPFTSGALDAGKVLTINASGAPTWQTPAGAVVTSSAGDPSSYVFAVSPKKGDWYNDTTAQALFLHSGTDWVKVGQADLHGLIAGGAVGQVLTKKSAADFDVEWQDVSTLLPAVTSFRGTVADVAALNALTNVDPGDMAITLSDGHMHVYANGSWSDIGPAQGSGLPSPAAAQAGDILTIVNGTPTWVAGAGLPAGQTGVPAPTAGDAGKVASVGTGGTIQWITPPAAAPGGTVLPTATAADNGKVLAVDAAGALTWQTPAAAAAPTSFKGSVANAAALPTTAALGDVYVTTDDGHIHVVTAAGPPAVYDNIGPVQGGTLPAATTANNGQVLSVVNGVPTWQAAAAPPAGFVETTAAAYAALKAAGTVSPTTLYVIKG